MSEKCTWNGTPGSRSSSATSSTPAKSPGRDERTVGDGVQVREIDDRPDPAAGAGRDREHVLGGAELAHPAHDLDAEGHGAVLALQPLSELPQLLHDRVDRLCALAAEKEAGVEDDELRAGRLRDPGRVVEHADRHPLLLVPLDVPHEAGDRRVDREHDPGVSCQLSEALGPRVVHPELSLEIELVGGVAALEQKLDRRLGGFPRRHARRSKVELRHGRTVATRAV